MTDQVDSLRRRYSVLSNDELQNIAVTGGLSDQAREVLSLELQRRGIEDVNEYREHLRSAEQDYVQKKQKALERREKSIRLYGYIGYSLSCVGVLAGLFVLYVQRDERNGIGIIVASVILLPLVWIISLVRRVVWRFLLRP
jgi:hypothetical protein